MSGSVSVGSNAPNSPATLALTGTGTQAGISFSPSSVSFGAVTDGQSNSQPVKISNPGNAALTISTATVTGAGFSASGLTTPLTIQPGQSTSFDVVFDPASATSSSGSVSFATNAPNSPAILALNGTGNAAKYSLSVTPSSVAFGTVNLNTSNSQSVSLQNTGNSKITVFAVTSTGAGFSDSGVNVGLVLTPNQSATLTITFDPTTAGAASGSVAITSNAANSPQTVSLTGTAATSHAVELAWTVSSSSSVVGYNIYRGTVSGTYSKLNASPVANPSYTDSTVQSGQNITYYYVVTSVDPAGAESTDSNQATATVP